MRSSRNRLPTALTIAGSDSGGGAGIQADLKTFAALGVFGTSAITCLTAQNPTRVSAIEPCSERMLLKQLEAIFEQSRPDSAKTGMLYSGSLVRTVAGFFRDHRTVPLVVDPVIISTSRTPLLDKTGFTALQENLLPLASLVTPNVAEAELLLRTSLKTPDDLRAAALNLHDKFGCAVLVKGGHLRGVDQAMDIFYDGKTELLLSAPFVRGVKTHGTGCTYSAAIAGFLARGYSLIQAVQKAKQVITDAIAACRSVGRHSVLGWDCP